MLGTKLMKKVMTSKGFQDSVIRELFSAHFSNTSSINHLCRRPIMNAGRLLILAINKGKISKDQINTNESLDLSLRKRILNFWPSDRI